MSRTYTLGELETKVRQRGGYEEQDGNYDDSYFTQTLVFDFLDSAHTELYDRLVQADDDYFVTASLFTLTSSVQDYSFPSDFYRFRGVDVRSDNGTDWVPLDEYSWHERGSYSDSRVANLRYDATALAYRPYGSFLRFEPTPTEAREVRLTYVPVATKLTGSAQTVDGVNGYEELVVLLALRRCRVREGTSTVEVDQEIQRQELRIQKVKKRNRGASKRRAEPGDWGNG